MNERCDNVRNSKNPDTIRNRIWRDKNPDKALANRIRAAYRLLARCGIIDGSKVVKDPTR